MQLLDPETERVVCEKKQNVTINANATANVDFSFEAQATLRSSYAASRQREKASATVSSIICRCCRAERE